MLDSFKSKFGLFNNHDNLGQCLSSVKPEGSTSLRDSIAKGISRILQMNGELDKYGIKDRHFLHIIITDGQDNNSEVTVEQLGILMLILGQTIPKQMITNHFIGIDLEKNSKDAAELLALSILGGDTSDIHLAEGKSMNDIFNRIQAKCGIITQTSLQALQVGDIGVVGLQQRQRGFISLSIKKFIVLFNLDISGSMVGTRWNQLRKCITQFTERLTSQDLVSVILFNDAVTFLNPSQTRYITGKDINVQIQKQSSQVNKKQVQAASKKTKNTSLSKNKQSPQAYQKQVYAAPVEQSPQVYQKKVYSAPEKTYEEESSSIFDCCKDCKIF
ncbi:hypothetical protein ABPG72_022360 [Tetrahymena utriculariae]